MCICRDRIRLYSADTTLKRGNSKWNFRANLCVLHSTRSTCGLGVGNVCSLQAQTSQASHWHWWAGLLESLHSVRHNCQNFKGVQWNGWTDILCFQLGSKLLTSSSMLKTRKVSKGHFERPQSLEIAPFSAPSPPSSNWLKQNFVHSNFAMQ